MGQHEPWKRLEHEPSQFYSAHTHKAAPHIFHSHRQPISSPPGWRPADDGATNHDQYIAHCAASGARPCVFIPSRVFPAPMVDMGDGACADQVLAGPCGPVGAGAPCRRRYGHRASWPQGVWQGTASRCRAVVSPLYGLSLGAYMGRHLGARETALRATALGPPCLGRLGPVPQRGIVSTARGIRRQRPSPDCCWHVSYAGFRSVTSSS